MVVKHEIRDRIDAEAVEHPEADLRMPLEHEPLRRCERAGLAQQVLRKRELAEVVQARGEPDQLDLLAIEAEPDGDVDRELGDSMRMEAGVDVARVDGACKARGRAQSRGAVAAAREALQLRELDDVGAIAAGLVLAVLLRPVEGAVDEAQQLVAVRRVRGRDSDACADGDGAHLLEVQGPDAVDDRLGGGEGLVLLVAGQQDGELVAAEPEGLSRLAEARRHPRQDTVAGGMAEAVVDSLEVVDVD